MTRIEEVLNTLILLEKTYPNGVSATDIAEVLDADRSNISRYLNILHREGRLEKLDGRPVLYKSDDKNKNSLDKMVGANQSLAIPIEKAKAAILYPPKGLHTLILGKTENLEFVDVRIISATTENPKSNLFRTLTRRIPTIITLPPIKDRSLSERYTFIETFIREESHRIGRSIYINKNSIISYLLYDCPNNIGQLKSDIQLACAKAFLNYRSQNTDYIIITQGEYRPIL
jgi:transcriptional regulator with AAA-type ATPase domain